MEYPTNILYHTTRMGRDIPSPYPIPWYGMVWDGTGFFVGIPILFRGVEECMDTAFCTAIAHQSIYLFQNHCIGFSPMQPHLCIYVATFSL